jgi:hypothetical protein
MTTLTSDARPTWENKARRGMLRAANVGRAAKGVAQANTKLKSKLRMPSWAIQSKRLSTVTLSAGGTDRLCANSRTARDPVTPG